jgi:MFS transporter, DHA1 family, inner membrane transport protein
MPQSQRALFWLNLHYALRVIAIAGGGAFFGAHLLAVGLSPVAVMIAVALIFVGRLLIRPLVVVAGERYGLRRLVAFGTAVNAVQFLILGDLHGIGVHLVALILVSALGEMVYWTCYHAYFAQLGDNDARGAQISVREAIATAVGVASPLATAWMLATYGPRIAFGITALFMLLAALPLAGAPDVDVPRLPRDAIGAPRESLILFGAEGWISASYGVIWNIALFLALGGNVMTYGWALVLAALTGAGSGLVLGRFIDRGGGGGAAMLALAVMVAIALLRAASTGNAMWAIIANALGAFGGALYIPTLMTAIYSEAKRAPCALRFNVATEGAWDMAAASCLLTAAALLALGVPIAAVMLLCLFGQAVVYVSLRRYYAGRGVAPAGI